MEPTRPRPRSGVAARSRWCRPLLALLCAAGPLAAVAGAATPGAAAAAATGAPLGASATAGPAATSVPRAPTAGARPRRGSVRVRPTARSTRAAADATAATASTTGVAGAPFTNTVGSASATPKLSYYGGPVMSTVKLARVVYGTAGSFVTPGAGEGTVVDFLQRLAPSGYISELAEYDTAIADAYGRVGTQQHITAGSYLGEFTIAPNPARNLVRITDDDVQAELSAQIDAAILPAPTADAKGYGTTLYTVFFRNGQTICDGTDCSLAPGGFCVYHSGFRLHGTGPMVLYTVQPDLAGFGNNGCGPGDDFQVTTAALAHEIAEAVTDPEVGFATLLDKPLAWYDYNDSGLAENADICGQDYGPLTLGGVAYTVQQTWSNASEACVTMGVPRSPGEFQLQPRSAVVLAGGSTEVTVRVLGTGPSTYSVSGLPAGVTATFSANPLDLGESAALSIVASDATAPGTYPVTIANDAQPTPKHVTLSLAVVAANGSAASALDPDAPLARLVDTRTLGAPVAAGGVLRVHSTASGATAVVLNVVATEATVPGYVTVWPCSQPRPLASSLNTVPGRTVANLVTVAVGADADVCAYNSVGTVHLVVDQFSAYRATGGPVRSGRLIPLRPTRALDTRSPVAPFGPGETRTVDLRDAGVPSEAQAAVLTITAVDAPGNGFWAVWPSGPWPGTSNLNVTAGQTLANQAIVPVTLGSVQLRSLLGGHVVVDVAGYFTGATGTQSSAGLFHAITPQRALDTRTLGAAGVGGVLTLTSIVPPVSTAVSLNVTVTEPVAAGFATVFPAASSAPLASNLNFAAGDTVPGHVVVGLASGKVALTTNVPAHLVVDVAGWYG